MDVAFIQNSQHDVHRNQRSQNQDRFIGERTQKRRGRALKRRLNALRHANVGTRLIDHFGGGAERSTGRQVKRNRHDRKLPLVIDGQRRSARLKSRERAQRNLLPGGRVHINVLQRRWILLELRVHFHHHVILVELGENRGDLPLSEGVVQRVIDVPGQNSQPRGGVPVDGQRRQQSVIQLIGGHIAQFRQRLQLVHEFGNPLRQFIGVHIFQRILKLGAGNPVFHGQVLYRLHEQGNA